MTGDNSTAVKMTRAYDRLIVAILEEKPQNIIDAHLFEYAACDSKYMSCANGNKSFEEHAKELLEMAKKDAKNYFVHSQAGRKLPQFKKSPLGNKLGKGAFSPPGEES